MSLFQRQIGIVFFTGISIFATACAPNNTGTAAEEAVNKHSYVAVSGGVQSVPSAATAATTSTSFSSTSQSQQRTQALEYLVEGWGNHPKHLCIPATQKLILRVKPHAVYEPLLPLDTTLVNQRDGSLIYDGSPATYTQLRVRLSIPGTAAAWDYLANVESYSVSGEYSAYLRHVSGTSVSQTQYLSVPEYDVGHTIFGSNRYDGMCTFWEHELGRCSQVSSALRASESAECPTGQQKILITNIVSDYPCHNDRTNWCRGASVQTVPDYQHWLVTVQVATENTQSF